MNIRLMLLALLLSLGSCASLVSTDIDRRADFSQYQTFAWMPADVKVGKNPVYHSDLIHRNIKRTVEEEFARRGIVWDEQNPDFLVGYHTYTEKKARIYGGNGYPYGFYPFGYGYGWGLWRPYGMWGYPYRGWNNMPQQQTYTEGTLIIDVVDNRTKQLVWRGSVEGDVDNVARLQKQIAKGVQAILKKYPAPLEQSTPANPV